MYLTRVVIENSGPIRSFNLECEFNADGSPKPIILVGQNGSGKTNLLSLVTDALFEAAAVHYSNVLSRSGTDRSWFRLVGGRTTTVGTTGGFSILKFTHNGQEFIYKEKAGSVNSVETEARLGPDFASKLGWPSDGTFKEFIIPDEISKTLFESGVYLFFPSNRAEIPHWYNRGSLPDDEFDIFSSLSKNLKKPIQVQKGLDKVKQWILSLIMECRIDLKIIGEPAAQIVFDGDVGLALLNKRSLEFANQILREILEDDEVHFVWLGRKSPDKVGIARGQNILIYNLDALSSGQANMLALFGTILRYCDFSDFNPVINFQDVEGVCVIDEIDAHMHVNLQYTALPRLMKMFPRIQFIVSSHSPLFILGLKNEFGSEGMGLIEMPEGIKIEPESYSELGEAIRAVSETELFCQEILKKASEPGVPIVYVEGETDPQYLKRAAALLNKTAIMDRCEIEWIGAKDQAGQGFHTGKSALDQTLNVLRANPRLARRKVMLLYDNDAKKITLDCEVVSVRSMPTNLSNTKVKNGIENLLDDHSIIESDYQEVEERHGNGKIVTIKSIRKSALCERICQEGTARDFEKFEAVFDVIEQYLNFVQAQQPPSL